MISHYNFLRKPPADFGWDWGPALAPAGIYGGVLLVAYNTVYITGEMICLRQSCCVLQPDGVHLSPCVAHGLHAMQQWVVVPAHNTVTASPNSSKCATPFTLRIGSGSICRSVEQSWPFLHKLQEVLQELAIL